MYGSTYDPERELLGGGVWIFDVADSELCTSAAYRRYERIAVVAIRASLTRTERRCALAEEHVHHETSDDWPSFVIDDDTARRLIALDERRARRRADDRLIPDDGLRRARGHFGDVAVTMTEVAEWLEVTIEVLERRLARWRHPTGRGKR